MTKLRTTLATAATLFAITLPLAAQQTAAQQTAGNSLEREQAAKQPTSHTATQEASSPFAATAPTTAAAARGIAGQNDIENLNRATPTAVRATHHSQSTALMIVGGAGIVLGAILGGDGGNILMLGGGVVGLYGLYLYLE
jgi:hypothetical protein